jgi:hypothetical protein
VELSVTAIPPGTRLDALLADPAARLYPRCGFEQRETVNWRWRL